MFVDGFVNVYRTSPEAVISQWCLKYSAAAGGGTVGTAGPVAGGHTARHGVNFSSRVPRSPGAVCIVSSATCIGLTLDVRSMELTMQTRVLVWLA